MTVVKKTLASLVVVAAAVLFVLTLVHAVWYAPEPEAPAPANVISTPAAEVPVRLSIPSLGIDTAVQKVGIALSGNMMPPNNFTDVGWYKYGTAPGQTGSAVVDGHVDNGLALPGVFKHLSDIKVGDSVYVTTQSGQKLQFEVVDVEIYGYHDVPVDRVFSRADAAWLNLITCDGAFVGSQRTYDHRLVVYTQLVNIVS